ncbi:MAG: type II pantothenate kinase [Clostridiales bacterium]|nr:type II pantothenate kinase [Clostridiales bacterium]
MGYFIGIDIGGSTTKIVGLKDGKISGCLKVKAGDQITSAYGAFGKFLSENGLGLDSVEQIMFTGVGATFISDGMYHLPTKRVDEIRAIGYGGQFLSGLNRAIIVSMGTGTAFVHVCGREVKHLGGTGIGGGTLLGLSNKIFNIRNFDNIVELASQGNLANVDLAVGDISKEVISSMPMDTTASNFGKISDVASNADIALGILNMVFQTIGMFAVFASRYDHTNDVVLTGNLTTIAQARAIFDNLEKMYDIHYVIPPSAEYATAIGAALCHD